MFRSGPEARHHTEVRVEDLMSGRRVTRSTRISTAMLIRNRARERRSTLKSASSFTHQRDRAVIS